MSLFLRRVVFYTLLLIFLIIAPLLIAYTAGYRWSAPQGRFFKTGALSLISAPDSANVFLNHTASNYRTPALIRDLLPGNYQTELRKEGYYSWQKKLPVESERTTFALNIPLFRQTAPQLTKLTDQSPLGVTDSPIQSRAPFFLYYNKKINKIVVINNHTQKRIAEIDGSSALWREKPTPLLFVYSAHEIWQFNPETERATLVTRLLEEIRQAITLPQREAIILILNDRVRALELDTRDRQNSWDLAFFDEIKNSSLAGDGKTLFMEGTRESQTGVWKLELY